MIGWALSASLLLVEIPEHRLQDTLSSQSQS
jgi:hypothetical protein